MGYKYILVDVGCIECGEPSNIIGTYQFKEHAIAVRDTYRIDGDSWGRPEWRGQHSLNIFEYSEQENKWNEL